MKKFGIYTTMVLILAVVLSACSTSTPASSGAGNSPTNSAMTETMPAASETVAAVTEVPAAGNTVEVKISGFAFVPGDLAIKVGTTVKWTNEDSAAHTATDEGGAFNSGSLSKGRSYSFTFTKEGVYRYFCKFHPDMVATITVTK